MLKGRFFYSYIIVSYNSYTFANINIFSDTLMHEFAALLSHIDNSFDCFKIELSTLVFPIFAHLYIQLIAEGHTLQGKVVFFLLRVFSHFLTTLSTMVRYVEFFKTPFFMLTYRMMLYALLAHPTFQLFSFFQPQHSAKSLQKMCQKSTKSR